MVGTGLMFVKNRPALSTLPRDALPAALDSARERGKFSTARSVRKKSSRGVPTNFLDWLQTAVLA